MSAALVASSRLHVFRAIFAALAMVGMLVFGSAAPAHAAPAPGNTAPTACSFAGQPADTSALPVSRWAGATSDFHSRLGTKAWQDMANKLNRQGTTTVLYSMGNFTWVTTTGLVEGAVNFCALNLFGGLLDNTAGSLGQALLSSGLVAFFVALSAAAWIWRIGRAAGGGGNIAMIGQKALVLGIFAIMVTGAMSSTGGGAGETPAQRDANYVPGVGSPGWVMTKIDAVVSASAASVTHALVKNRDIEGIDRGGRTEKGTGPGPLAGRGNLGCAPYVKAMKDSYYKRYSEGFVGPAVDEANRPTGPLAARATTPLLLSTMWENSGLEMWIKAQLGDRNEYGRFMYCRILEYNVRNARNPKEFAEQQERLTTEEQRVIDTSTETLMKAAGVTSFKIDDETITPNYDSSMLAFRYSSSVKWRDRSFIGWAACSHPDTAKGVKMLHTDNASVSDHASDLGDHCQELFTKDGWDGGSGANEFDWDESNDDISGTKGIPGDAEDFLLTLHGNSNQAGLVTGIAYVFSSLLIAVVFVTFAIAIFIAKIGAMAMILMIFFVLLVSLLPKANASKVADYAKQYLGISLFVWGAQLILAIIALFTAILIEAGGSVVPDGPGGIMGLMWTGFAPLIAVISLNWLFKKMKIPSPLKVSSGAAWGQMAASGAVGGAVGAGAASAFGRGFQRRMGSQAYSKMTSTAKNAMAGKDRPDRMEPDSVRSERGSKKEAEAPGNTAPETDPTATGVVPDTTGGPGSGSESASERGGGQAPSDASHLSQDVREHREKKAYRDEEAAARRALGWQDAAKVKAKARVASVQETLKRSDEQFAASPIRSTLGGAKRVAKTGAKVVGATALVGMTGGTGLLVLGGAYGAKKAVAVRRKRHEQMLSGELSPLMKEHARRQQEQRAADGADPTIAQSNGEPPVVVDDGDQVSDAE